MVFERRKTVKKMDFEVEGLQRRTSKKSWPSEPDTRSSHFGFVVYPIVFAEADSRKISLLKMLLGHPSQSPYHFGIESFHLKVFLLSIFHLGVSRGRVRGSSFEIFKLIPSISAFSNVVRSSDSSILIPKSPDSVEFASHSRCSHLIWLELSTDSNYD